MKIRHDYARCSAASGVGGTDLRVGVAAVMGLASYYRKLLKGLANVAAILHRLLEKGAEWNWCKDCQFSFDAVNCAGPRISKTSISSTSSTRTPAETVLVCAEPKRSETRKSRRVIQSHADQG
ncbi:hypothetical protein T03_15005 [Trichinella britovi]|uniref:Uncharacterized protein n=1 Tax=Trichinella britovi TaxID=45882 RepID=A0A0V1C8A1_TRIBR|nr:hypothetical protein T03_15005 [Trichinella britovi]